MNKINDNKSPSNEMSDEILDRLQLVEMQIDNQRNVLLNIITAGDESYDNTSEKVQEMNDILEKIKGIQKDLLSFTLQIVSIIIGLFALILSVVVIITYRENMIFLQFVLLAVLLLLFSIIFGWWFILWNDKNFPKK